jgi:hypothetical protein
MMEWREVEEHELRGVFRRGDDGRVELAFGMREEDMQGQADRDASLVEVALHFDKGAPPPQGGRGATSGANNNQLRRTSEPPTSRLLLVAVQAKQATMVRMLLDAGAPLGASERSLLECAIDAQTPEIVRLLLDAHACLDTGRGERSLLECAVQAEDNELVHMLLDAGAPLGVGRTPPLRVAVQAQNEVLTRQLLEAGAPLDAGEGGKPLLQLAFDANNKKLVQLLLEGGASRTDVLPAVLAFPCQIPGPFKWSGIAALGNRLYCAPYHASDILVIDAARSASRRCPAASTGSSSTRASPPLATSFFARRTMRGRCW